MRQQHLLITALWLASCIPSLAQEGEPVAGASRTPADAAELEYWLGNMTAHGFHVSEMVAATGLSESEVADSLERFEIRASSPATDGKLRVLPYPGGRHPRIGFLEGAIRPQRETKFSVFAPWPRGGYAVVDVPEAIWFEPQGRKLLYLAHTHVPTFWSEQGIEMEPLEWNRHDDGSLTIQRRLPNRVEFGAKVRAVSDGVEMELWLTNGSQEKLTGLSVQNCVMLKSLTDFNQQSNDNKVFASPFVACKEPTGERWIITGWERCERPWGNVRCPCLHADPKFENCPPGETRRLKGWVSFYEGTDIESEFARLQGKVE